MRKQPFSEDAAAPPDNCDLSQILPCRSLPIVVVTPLRNHPRSWEVFHWTTLMKTSEKMNDVKANGRSETTLREIIRKELGSEANRRFLARMPAFRLEGPIPDEFRSLLGDLDRAERNRRTR